ncbi:TIM44-like domain-containing protein [Trinickia sp. EG282A]|uniref:Tim44 domain-containing protein n=1 Tax=Trinickia sp. EG282A TaxID=3237013 RepID=UPI0034D1C5C5
MTGSHSCAFNKLSKTLGKRIGSAVVVAVIAASTIASLDAHAKRLGGGRSVGRQAQMLQPSQNAPSSPRNPAQQQPMQQSAQPSQAQRAQQSPSPQPAPAASPRSRWLGPIAGLAAGLGIAALLSHFGLGSAFAGAMANIIVIALLAMIGIWLVRKLVSRGRRAPSPAYGAAGAATGATPFGSRPFGENRMQAGSDDAFGRRAGGAAWSGAGQSAGTAATLPAGFDEGTFLHHAKLNFARLQAAWDAGNVAEIRDLTTPEMFSELKRDIDARGRETNRTDVVQLNAELLGVEDRGPEYLASVRFSGLIRESAGAPAEPFSEVWNLTKSARAGEGWLLAGIQQSAPH